MNNFLTALPFFFCKLRHLPDTIKNGWCDHSTSLSVEKVLTYLTIIGKKIFSGCHAITPRENSLVPR